MNEDYAELIHQLNFAAARGAASADNANYYCPVTIGEVRKAANAITALIAERDALREALKELSTWNQKPLTDMASDDSQQLEDIRAAMATMCFVARDALK